MPYAEADSFHQPANVAKMASGQALDDDTHRVSKRSDHFMPASLLDSQFRALEPPRPGETGTVVDASASSEDIVHSMVVCLDLSGH
ncbi:MAG: hypothetical protein ACRDTG_11250 [Pseudonocardiaceae bacterium]